MFERLKNWLGTSAIRSGQASTKPGSPPPPSNIQSGSVDETLIIDGPGPRSPKSEAPDAATPSSEKRDRPSASDGKGFFVSWLEGSGTPSNDKASDSPDEATVIPGATSSVPVPISSDGGTIDHFELRKELGRGGFGTVHLAHDTKLDRMVALKILDRLDDESAKNMILDETRAAAKLAAHPNIVSVFQAGRDIRGRYIVFEYIPGKSKSDADTLKDVVKQSNGNLPKEDAVRYLKQIASALGHAHENGVLHRDVKPQNILIDFKNTAYLADFGCAHRPHNVTGRSLVGTIPYMSPEQLKNDPTEQSDIWSMGITAYEVLGGSRPFPTTRTSSVRETARLQLETIESHHLPSIRSRVPSIDRDLDAIISKCLEKNLEDRYQTAAEVFEEFERWERNEPVNARPVGKWERLRRWAKRNPQIAAQLGTIAALVIGIVTATGIVSVVMSTLLVRKNNAEQAFVAREIRDVLADPVTPSSVDDAAETIAREPFGKYAADQLTACWAETSNDPQSVDNRKRGTAARGTAALKTAALVVSFSGREQNKGRIPDSVLSQTQTYLCDRVTKGQLSPQEFATIRSLVEDKKIPSTEFSELDPDHSIASSLMDVVLQLQNSPTQGSLSPANVNETSNPSGKHLNQDTKMNADWSADRLANLAGKFLDQNVAGIDDWLEQTPSDSQFRKTLANVIENNFRITALGETQQFKIDRLMLALKNSPTELIEQIKNADRGSELSQLAKKNEQPLRRLLAEVDLNQLQPEQFANVCIMLLSYGDFDSAASIFNLQENTDRSTESARRTTRQFVDFASYALRPHQLLSTIDQLDDTIQFTPARQMILHALGQHELPWDESLVTKVSDLYLDTRFAAVHSSAEWVLRKWEKPLPHTNSNDVAKVETTWCMNSEGQHFALIEGEDSDFWISTKEVTFADYKKFVDDQSNFLTKFREPIYLFNEAEGREQTNEDFLNPVLHDEDRDRPAVHVSFSRMLLYCNWLSRKTGQSPAYVFANGEHWPSDEQLKDLFLQATAGLPQKNRLTCDQAAGGPRLTTLREWKMVWKKTHAADISDEHIGRKVKALGAFGNRTLSVGQYHPNSHGLFDMIGNVSELCFPPPSTSLRALGSSFASNVLVTEEDVDCTDSGELTMGFRLVMSKKSL